VLEDLARPTQRDELRHDLALSIVCRRNENDFPLPRRRLDAADRRRFQPAFLLAFAAPTTMLALCVETLKGIERKAVRHEH
jgi:hypothetical protein